MYKEGRKYLNVNEAFLNCTVCTKEEVMEKQELS
jgi:hypothetical protein